MAEPETLKPKPETRNLKPEPMCLNEQLVGMLDGRTIDPKPCTRNPKPETRNLKPETLCVNEQLVGMLEGANDNRKTLTYITIACTAIYPLAWYAAKLPPSCHISAS